jgi:hypothetical protein
MRFSSLTRSEGMLMCTDFIYFISSSQHSDCAQVSHFLIRDISLLSLRPLHVHTHPIIFSYSTERPLFSEWVVITLHDTRVPTMPVTEVLCCTVGDGKPLCAHVRQHSLCFTYLLVSVFLSLTLLLALLCSLWFARSLYLRSLARLKCIGFFLSIIICCHPRFSHILFTPLPPFRRHPSSAAQWQRALGDAAREGVCAVLRQLSKPLVWIHHVGNAGTALSNFCGFDLVLLLLFFS